MSEAGSDLDSPALGILDRKRLLECLELMAMQLGAHCLLASDDGRLMAHALADDEPSAAVVVAVLRRTLAPIAHGLHRERTLGVVPGGAVLAGRHAGVNGPIVSLPVVAGGRRHGVLWLLLPSCVPSLTELAAAGMRLGRMLQSSSELSELDMLRQALQGCGPLPQGLFPDDAAVRVAAVSGAVAANAVENAMARAAGSGAHVVLLAELVHVVVEDAPDCRLRLEAHVRRASAQLGEPLSATLSEAFRASKVSLAREQSVLALRHGGRLGRLVPAGEARATVILDVLSLEDLPGWGPSPVHLLLAHDARRQTVLARTLLVWLDGHGDTASAAASLNVHPNTLRYRLRSACKVLGNDLSDPDARLEVHLRLRRTFRGAGRTGSCTTTTTSLPTATATACAKDTTKT